MQRGKLIRDVESIVAKGRVYGRCGEEVKVVADCVNVLIVEDKEGGRFPVKKELVEIIQDKGTYSNRTDESNNRKDASTGRGVKVILSDIVESIVIPHEGGPINGNR